jgi:hypothetical protein
MKQWPYQFITPLQELCIVVTTVNGQLIITSFRRDLTTAENKNGRAYPMENTKIPKFYLYNFAERAGWRSKNARKVPRSNPGQVIVYPEVFRGTPSSSQENTTIIPRLARDLFLPNPFDCIIRKSF